jgi:hypothetical protein
MKLEQVLEQIATQSTDVKGVQKVVEPIVRRVVPAGYTVMSTSKKKKKKKNVKREN